MRVTLVLFGLIGMMPVQYTYMAAIHASNNATATVLQFTAPAMVAVWLVVRRRRLPDIRELAAIALAVLGTFLLATHGRIGALSISRNRTVLGLGQRGSGGVQFAAAGEHAQAPWRRRGGGLGHGGRRRGAVVPACALEGAGPVGRTSAVGSSLSS